jgi:hypothetical protein
MGTVLRKSVTRPLPAGAVVASRRRRATARELRQEPGRQSVVEQVATWRDRTGKKRTAVAVAAGDGSLRVRVESETFYAKYRDGEGIVRVVPTGCRDKQAAQSKLAELERTADKVRAGALTVAELRVAGHNKTPTAAHVADYVEYLRQKGTHRDRVNTTEARLLELVDACGFQCLRDLNADALLAWLSTQEAAGRSAAVLNGYIACAVAFGYWLAGKRTTKRRANQLGEKRLPQNPFAGVGKYDERADRRRERRALSEPELRRLLYVARWRPLAERGREAERLAADKLPASTQSRRTWKAKPLSLESLPAAIESARAAGTRTGVGLQVGRSDGLPSRRNCVADRGAPRPRRRLSAVASPGHQERRRRRLAAAWRSGRRLAGLAGDAAKRSNPRRCRDAGG